MSRRRDIDNEDGWILITAIVLMAIMITVALASFALVDTGQGKSREQRERETSLNVAEGVLYSQGFTLAQSWPGNGLAANALPPFCDETTSAVASCPNASTLAAANAAVPAAANFTNVDATANVKWTTKVRDNGSPLAGAYVSSQADAAQSGTNVQSHTAYTCAAPCRWDANGDKQLWVQARAVVRGKPRNLVALLKLERILEATPEAGVTAGGINVANNGNKIMLYAAGSQVIVRCNTAATSCVNYQSGQIQPAPQTAVNAPPMLTPSQLARFKKRAITDGKYFSGCPGNDLSGAVVWVEDCPDYTANNSTVTQNCTPDPPPSPGGGGNGLADNCINQYGSPGILIWHCGGAHLAGSITYVGILYGVNNSDGTCPPSNGTRNGNCNGNVNSASNVFAMTGGFGVWGALAIDGPGCLYVGSNGIQVQFDPNVFGAVASYGTVGLIQNTWRELAPN